MKLIVLAIMSITLFRADCKERPGQQEISNNEREQSVAELRGGSKCKKKDLDRISEDLKSLKTDLALIKERQVCSSNEGMFQIGDQCFKRFAILKTWDEALKHCDDNGLKLAQPMNPVLLAKYMIEMGWFINVPMVRHWLGAQGTGSCMKWLNRDCIPNDSNLWEYARHNGQGKPDSVATNTALDMYGLNDFPQHPLDVDGKTSKRYFICEK